MSGLTNEVNNNNMFCENLYNSMVELFDKPSSKYIVKKEAFMSTVTILPHGFYEVINSVQHKEYLSSLEFKFNDKGQKIKISLKEKDDGVKYVVLKIYSQTNHIKTNFVDIYPVHDDLKNTILFYNSKDVYAVGKSGNFYPVAVSDFKYAPIEICEYVFMYYSNGCMIWKDFLSEKFFPPIKLNTLSDYHNKKEFFEKQFNVALPNSVNKSPFLKTYAACCAKDYIIPEEIPILFSKTNEFPFSFLPNKRNKKKIAAIYLKEYICGRTKIDESIILDYIEFSFILKEPINILAGKKKIQAHHDILTDKMLLKGNYGKKLVIPETPLKYLRLPEEFILLRTKKALIFEGRRNHNCVGVYVNKINKGCCIIYAADINGEHLTIDIRYRKSRKKNRKYDFYVHQCYKSYNRSCKNETLKYVKECVENSSEKAVENYEKRILTINQ